MEPGSWPHEGKMIPLNLKANLGHLLWVQTDKFHFAFYGLRTRSPVPISSNSSWVLRKSRLYSQKLPQVLQIGPFQSREIGHGTREL